MNLTKSLIIFLVLLFIILQYELWFANDSIPEIFHLKNIMSQQSKKNKKIYKKNKKLAIKIHNLKAGKHNAEALAREQIGMIKKGETYYQIVSQDSGDQPHSPKN